MRISEIKSIWKELLKSNLIYKLIFIIFLAIALSLRFCNHGQVNGLFEQRNDLLNSFNYKSPSAANRNNLSKYSGYDNELLLSNYSPLTKKYETVALFPPSTFELKERISLIFKEQKYPENEFLKMGEK